MNTFFTNHHQGTLMAIDLYPAKRPTSSTTVSWHEKQDNRLSALPYTS